MKSTFNTMEQAELEKKVSDLRMQLMKLNSELASKSGGKSVGQLHKLKKSIAQAMTALSIKRREVVVKTSAPAEKERRDVKKDE